MLGPGTSSSAGVAEQVRRNAAWYHWLTVRPSIDRSARRQCSIECAIDAFIVEPPVFISLHWTVTGMDTPKTAVQESPVGFDYAVAYALHPDMRRLIILYIVGTLLLPTGISWILAPPIVPFVGIVLGIIVSVVGAVFLFGGLVGTLFKLVTDANIMANQYRAE